MLVSCAEARDSLLFTIGGVFTSGGVFFCLCLGLVDCLGFDGRERRVKEPRGEDAFEVDVDEEDVLAGGLVTGSSPRSCSLSSDELLELYVTDVLVTIAKLKFND